MDRSTEILQKASGRGLTMSERQELRESYLYEQQQKDSAGHKVAQTVKNYKADNSLNLPRHLMNGKCADFQECPIDFKCRNYNSSYIKCQNCPLHETDQICKKPQLHNENTFGMWFKNRERIDLDAK